MRRFINSLPGRAICQLVVVALVLPFLSIFPAANAVAQIQAQPRWAVVEFVNAGKGGQAIGATAADAVYSELAKTNKYDLEPVESVNRAIDQLGLVKPVNDKTSLLRLAQELKVSTLVTGTVANWQVRTVPGGRQADVAVKVMALDVASGLPINGALINEHSAVRAGDPADETLIAEALTAASAAAVFQMTTRALPSATVLNTRSDAALINRLLDQWRD